MMSEIAFPSDRGRYLHWNFLTEVRDLTFDLVFSVFATLDFGFDHHVAESLSRLVGDQGTLLIYVPDFLEEVAQMCGQNVNLVPLEEYRNGATEIKKVDHFTGEAERFVAHRIELTISLLLERHFTLRALRILRRSAGRRVFALEFGRAS